MKNRILLILFLIFGLSLVEGQNIESTWLLEELNTTVRNDSFGFDQSIEELSLENGMFNLTLQDYDNEVSGDYIYQNNLLVFYFNKPSDTIRRFRISELTDSTLVLKERDYLYSFKSQTYKSVPNTVNENATLIPSQGFSVESLYRGAIGMFVLLLLSYLLSKNRRAINWRTVGFGLLAQLTLAIGVLKVPFIQSAFEWVGGLFIAVLDFTMAGTKFLFAAFSTNEISDSLMTFAVSILPTIIFFSALTSVLFYLGIIQKIVKAFAWLLTKLLQISGAESLGVAGNIFLGQTESPLMIKAYLEKMTKSEILLVMVGGMATVAGGVLAAYIGFLGGEDEALRLFYAKHLLTASVMAAPGAIVISKMLYPQQEKINTNLEISQENIGSNILDAIANGTTEGLKLAVNVGAMLLVFLAFIAMINGILGWVGDITSLNDWV
ncbi:MAG: Na+ dependent nucleoside transporter, partial [Winogradskyella sp.]|nr:Na+ dependent nucleoside transporter [Winogradskyella sp.]